MSTLKVKTALSVISQLTDEEKKEIMERIHGPPVFYLFCTENCRYEPPITTVVLRFQGLDSRSIINWLGSHRETLIKEVETRVFIRDLPDFLKTCNFEILNNKTLDFEVGFTSGHFTLAEMNYQAKYIYEKLLLMDIDKEDSLVIT